MSWFGAKQVPHARATSLLASDFKQLASEPLVINGAFPAALGSSPYAVFHIVQALTHEAGQTMCCPLGCQAPQLRLGDLFARSAELPAGALYECADALDASAFARAAFSGLPYAGPLDGMASGEMRAALLVAAKGGATPIRRLPGLAAWLLVVDGTVSVYLRRSGPEGSAAWQAVLGQADTLMVPEGCAFQVLFSSERNLAVLSPFVPARRLPPGAAGPPPSLPLPRELSHRGAVAPVHLQERHAFLEAYRAAARRAGGLCGGAVVRVVSLAGPRNAARRRLVEAELLGPLRRELGADVEFFDAVNGRALGLQAEAMGRGVRQRCAFHRLPDGRELWADVDPSLWVGLASEPERQAHLKRHAAMFQAELDRAAFHHGLYEPAAPSLGMVGNHLSHAALWHELEAAGTEWALIVEDDAAPDPRLATSWPEVLRAVAAEVEELRARGESWDLLFVGRTISGTPEGCDVTPLTVEVGWTLRTHCYAISQKGVQRLIACGLSSHVFHCAMDEVLAAMAAGDHWHAAFATRLRELGCLGAPCRLLGFRFEGAVLQLMDIETTDRSESQCVGEGAERI